MSHVLGTVLGPGDKVVNKRNKSSVCLLTLSYIVRILSLCYISCKYLFVALSFNFVLSFCFIEILHFNYLFYRTDFFIFKNIKYLAIFFYVLK